MLVDVVVLGRDGHPVRGLHREDFRLLEDSAPQTLKRFEEHTAAAAASVGAPLQLPPGTFSDYTPVPPSASLNVVLLDSLNTAVTDQSYVQIQLQQYVKHAPPGNRIAIFGLSDHVYLLQGFTSDPEILKAAVSRKLTPQTSNLLPDAAGNQAGGNALSDMLSDGPPPPPGQTSSLEQIGDNLRQFENGLANVQQQLRVQGTLDAFNELGHYLANFPGRKNLIWFSGSFPLNILPDPSSQGGAGPQSGSQYTVSNNDEFRDTINLLTRAQVAVYPVDARGLMSNPMYSAQRSGRQYRNPASITAELAQRNQQQAAEHSTMDQLADETGGHAYYNTNGLADAVTSAVDAGANFYTLAYTPSRQGQNGEFRRIRVSLTGAAAPADAKLSYRQGYYAAAPSDLHTPAGTGAAAATTPAARAAATYARAAMSLGAPAPEDVLFKVRVLPASTATEETVAPGNQIDPAMKVTGPFRRFAVDLAIPPSQLHLVSQPDGRHTGKIDAVAFVYDSDGRVLNRVGKVIDLNLEPETYKRFMEGAVNLHLDVSSPAAGQTYLRIGVHDISSNRLGVVEIPTAAISRLPPNAPADK